MTIGSDDLARRVQAQEMVLTQLLAHAQSKDGADLLAHLEQIFTVKGQTNDRADGGPDSTQHAHSIIEAAKKVAAVHQG